jgi:hypothetical protein
MDYRSGTNAYKIWGELSAYHARKASGNVHVFQNAQWGINAGLGRQSIWGVYEYLALMANPRVNRIIYHFNY